MGIFNFNKSEDELFHALLRKGTSQEIATQTILIRRVIEENKIK